MNHKHIYSIHFEYALALQYLIQIFLKSNKQEHDNYLPFLLDKFENHLISLQLYTTNKVHINLK